MTLTATVVDPIANFEKAEPLLVANWAETGASIEFKPADLFKFYGYIAKCGLLQAVLIHDGDKLVGYCSLTTVPSPFNHSYLVANADGIYVLPEYRGGRALKLIMDEIEKLARTNKANAIHWHATEGTAFEEVLEARYKPQSRYFRKELAYE